jgi:sirohydrochlorin ferrochelatase
MTICKPSPRRDAKPHHDGQSVETLTVEKRESSEVSGAVAPTQVSEDLSSTAGSAWTDTDALNGEIMDGKPKASRRKPKTPYAKHNIDAEEAKQYALGKGLSVQEIIEVRDNFKNWCESIDQHYSNWNAAWRNQVDTYVKRKNGSRYGGKPSTADLIRDL